MKNLEYIKGIPYEGELYECENCGAELLIPEDRDIPTECPECNILFQ